MISILLAGWLSCFVLDYKYDVKVAGAMRNIMQNNDLSAKIALDTLVPTANLYGLGPIEGLEGEVIILNSIPYVSSVDDGKVVTKQTQKVKAAMLVYTQVKNWQTTQLTSPVKNYAELERVIEKYAKAKGVDLSKPFPFLLEGKVTRTSFHVIDWQEGVTHTAANHKQFAKYGELKNEEVQIVGFYSDKHHSIFTHHTTNMHLHVVNKAKTLVGHLDDIVLQNQIVLKLPQ
jgi:acetolactate decarboxylase